MQRSLARVGQAAPFRRTRDSGARRPRGRSRSRRLGDTRESPGRALIEAALRPRGPYSLRLSTRLASDATRIVRDGRLRAALVVDGRIEHTLAWQRPDGVVCVSADSAEAVDRVRFVLGLDDDHTPFLARFADDPLLGGTVRLLRWLR